eukprot:161213-Pleurochrysis_carterae.AAC.3
MEGQVEARTADIAEARRIIMAGGEAVEQCVNLYMIHHQMLIDTYSQLSITRSRCDPEDRHIASCTSLQDCTRCAVRFSRS